MSQFFPEYTICDTSELQITESDYLTDNHESSGFFADSSFQNGIYIVISADFK